MGASSLLFPSPSTGANGGDSTNSGTDDSSNGCGSSGAGKGTRGSLTRTPRIAAESRGIGVSGGANKIADTATNDATDDADADVGRAPQRNSTSSEAPKESSKSRPHGGFISDELRGFVIDKLNSEYVVPNPVTGELELRRGAYCQVGELIGKSHGTVKGIWLNREVDPETLRHQRRHRKDTTAAEKDAIVHDLLLGATRDDETGKIAVKKGAYTKMAAKFNVTESTARRIFRVAEQEYKRGFGFKYPHDRKLNSGSGKKRIMSIGQFKEAILTIPRGHRTIPNMAKAISASESTVSAYLQEAPNLNMLVDCALGSRPRKPKDKEIYREAILSLPEGGRKCMAVAKVMGVSDSAVRDFVRLEENEDLLALIDSKRGLTVLGKKGKKISTEHVDGVKLTKTPVLFASQSPTCTTETQCCDASSAAPATATAKQATTTQTATRPPTYSAKTRAKATPGSTKVATSAVTLKKPVAKRVAAAGKQEPKKRLQTSKVAFQESCKARPATAAPVTTTTIVAGPTNKNPPSACTDDAPSARRATTAASNAKSASHTDQNIAALLARQQDLQKKMAEMQAELARIEATVSEAQMAISGPEDGGQQE